MATEIQQAIETLRRQINEYRNDYMKDKFLYDNVEWDCDDAGRDNINDLYDAVLLGGGVVPPQTPTWRDYNNVDRPLASGPYVITMKIAMITHFAMCHMAARYHKEAVGDLTTVEEVNAYNFYSGWPNVTPV
jgi:hypothetical protein